MALVATVSCAGARVPTTGAPLRTPADDRGLTLAENSGPTLIVLSLDPAEPGANDLAVDLRDPSGAPVPGAVRVDVTVAGAEAHVSLPVGDRHGTVTLPRADRVELRTTVTDGPSHGTSATFVTDIPAQRVSDGTLGQIDRAMQGLSSLREAQTLTSGGPTLIFHFDYLAPDRVRYTWVGSTGAQQETRLIGRDRFDREGAGKWTHADLGLPSRVPHSAYATGAARVRLIGHDGGLLEIAFVQPANVYYRVRFGADDHLVRSYVMMTTGHYMTGAYSDYDAPIAISPP